MSRHDVIKEVCPLAWQSIFFMFDFAFAGKFDHASHHINFRKEDPSLFKRKQPRLSKKSKESSSIQVAVKATPHY